MEIPSKTKGEHFSLRWNSYSNNLMQMLLDHQNHEELVDVTLCCEGQFVKAHKLVLSACSQVFQDMFKLHTVQQPVIFLNGMKFKYFKHILDFMYQGEAKVLDVDLVGVLTLGEDLQVKGLSSLKLRHQVCTEEPKTTTLRQDPNVSETISPGPVSHKIATMPMLKELNSPLHSHSRRERSVLKRMQSNENVFSKVNNMSKQVQEPIVDRNKVGILDDLKKKKEKISMEKTCESSSSTPNNSISYSRTSNGKTNTTKNSNGKTISESEKTPRPASAFMIFANEWRKKLAVEHPDENNKSISLRLGNIWKSLSNETKESYYDMANKMEQKGQCLDSETTRTGAPKRRKIERQKSVESVSHLVSVDLQEFDDDLQIIGLNDDLIYVPNLPQTSKPNTENT